MSEKGENEQETVEESREEADRPEEASAAADPEGSDGSLEQEGKTTRFSSLSAFGSKNARIAAAGVGAVLVAGALFLAPGDRLLGIESSSAGIERHHDGDDHGEDSDHHDDGEGSDRHDDGGERGDYGDYDHGREGDRGFDRGGQQSGQYPSPPAPGKLGTSQS